MVFPSGENLVLDSTPGVELNLIANPPSLGTNQRSLAYVKTIFVLDTSGKRKSPASICADTEIPIKRPRHVKR